MPRAEALGIASGGELRVCLGRRPCRLPRAAGGTKARRSFLFQILIALSLTVCTWNINSVRIRLDIVRAAVEELRPDVLCLQETKCQDDKFPLKAIRELGFEHIALNGQKGWHGVATFSKVPFAQVRKGDFCGKGDARHVAVTLAAGDALGKPLTIHNFYVPAGGDIPDPELNPKFAHKLAFLDEVTAWPALLADAGDEARHAVLVGDLNIAPLETDVWGHKQLLNVVSHSLANGGGGEALAQREEHMRQLRAIGRPPAFRDHLPMPHQHEAV